MMKSILYDSNTGNTEAMAEAIAEGARASGDEVYLARVNEADLDKVLGSDVVYLGCPAMGVEMVGDAMTDFCREVGNRFEGKKVAIFGSCAHGEGIWLRSWGSQLGARGATVVNKLGLIAVSHPSEEILVKCRELGASRF